MSAQRFRIIEHTLPGQHVREYPRGTRSHEDDVVRIAIKQYVPKDADENDPAAITVIGAHANGFPKETYEPLWDELLERSKRYGVRIRGIWIADMCNHGASAALNEGVLGDDPSYFDHSRDLLHMINTFRAEIRRPIVGIGHSIGATKLVALSLMHPRLFAGLILLEPMIQQDVPPGPNFARGSTMRPDVWPSYEEAVTAFRKNKFFSTLDPRVFDKMLAHGLRKTPTEVYPDEKGAYTLSTTKHQEVWSYLRPQLAPLERQPDDQPTRHERLLYPDVDPKWQGIYLFFRPELAMSFELLPYVRPPVLYVFGGKSSMSTPMLQDAKVDRTGTGLGGNGGSKAENVMKHVFPAYGHMFPLEHVSEAMDVVAKYLGEHLKAWREDELFLREHDVGKSERGVVVSKTWREKVRNDGRARRPMAMVKERL